MKKLIFLLSLTLIFACQETNDVQPVVDEVPVSVAKTMDVLGIEVDLEVEGDANARGHWKKKCYVPEKPKSNCDDPDMITFDDQGFTAGDFVDKVEMGAGTVTIFVDGANIRFPGQNAAMIFDSNNPNPDGDDRDLGTPNQAYGGPGIGDGGASNKLELNNLLILSEDMDPTDPDDDNWSNGKIYFDFSDIEGGATVISLDVVDIDQEQADREAYVLLQDADGNDIKKLLIPATGDNGYARIDLEKTAGVYTMVVRLAGSGAIDNLAYCYEGADPCGCTKTWQQWSSTNDGWNKIWKGQNTKFYRSGMTWGEILNSQSNDVYIVLAKEYIAAVLNIKNGVCVPDAIKWKVLKASLFFKWYRPNQCRSLSKRTQNKIGAWAVKLEKYNTGLIGPGSCN